MPAQSDTTRRIRTALTLSPGRTFFGQIDSATEATVARPN